MLSIRPATLTDIEFLNGLELAPIETKLKEVLDSGNIQIAMADNTSVGFLSFSILWGKLPFLELIEVLVSQRGQKFDAGTVRAWEQDMRSRGFDLVLTSTNADGDAQHFWRKMGYVDCGALTVRGKAAEIFFQRSL